MSDLEKQCIQDDKLRKLVLKHFKKINKIKKDNINEFITKNKLKLDKISSGKNWKIWLLGTKQKYNKLKKEEEERLRDGKGTGLKKKNNTLSDEFSLEDDFREAEKEYEKNKRREKKRREKEKKEIEDQLKPYNAKLIEYKDIDENIKKGNNVLVLANGDNIIISDDNLEKLKEDENQFIEELDDGRIMLTDNIKKNSDEQDSDDEEEDSDEEKR